LASLAGSREIQVISMKRGENVATQYPDRQTAASLDLA
jgi:hypothetical protein